MIRAIHANPPLAVLALSGFLFIASVWGVGYSGRVDIRERLLLGCERSKADRIAQAASWDAQARADRIVAYDMDQPAKTRAARRDGYRTHFKTAAGLRARIVPCEQAYPPPSLLPKF